MKKYYLFLILSLLTVGIVGLILVQDRLPGLSEKQAVEPPPGQPVDQRPIREALKEGDVFRAIPTPDPDQPVTDDSPPVIRRVETQTGEVVLFGRISSVSGDDLTLDYSEGQETVRLTAETTVFFVSADEGGNEIPKDLAFLRGLSFPQIGSVSYVAESLEVLSVTVFQSD